MLITLFVLIKMICGKKMKNDFVIVLEKFI